MNVVDSSAWLEYLTNGSHASFFATAITDTKALLVPSICIVELGCKILRERGDDAWLTVRGVLEAGTIVPLDGDLAAFAAELNTRTRLPLADSIIYATAVLHNATLWTQDADFSGLPDVKYKAKK